MWKPLPDMCSTAQCQCAGLSKVPLIRMVPLLQGPRESPPLEKTFCGSMLLRKSIPTSVCCSVSPALLWIQSKGFQLPLVLWG